MPYLRQDIGNSSEESERNWDKLTEGERRDVIERMNFLAELESSRLKSANQLPELIGDPITLVWNMVEFQNQKHTVIRHGDKVIWVEVACYEGYERFREVVRILKEKYGNRLIDVVPTKAASCTFMETASVRLMKWKKYVDH